MVIGGQSSLAWRKPQIILNSQPADPCCARYPKRARTAIRHTFMNGRCARSTPQHTAVVLQGWNTQRGTYKSFFPKIQPKQLSLPDANFQSKTANLIKSKSSGVLMRKAKHQAQYRVPSGSGGQLGLLQQHHVLHAAFGQVVGHAGAHAAPSDDHRLGRLLPSLAQRGRRVTDGMGEKHVGKCDI